MMSSVRAALALLFSLSAVNAMASDWVVVKVTQPARYTDDRKTWREVKRGMVLKNHSWLSTGNRARIVLERNKDQVVFQPGTMAGLYERASAVVHTDFAQQSGELRLSIDPRFTPHLAVQTPYMAALVKGTVFRVKVTEKGSSVAVERGRVQVSDVRSGETVGVSSGQKASVDDNPETSMTLSGSNKKFERIITIKPLGKVLQDILPGPATSKPLNQDKAQSGTGAEQGNASSRESGNDKNGGSAGSSNSSSNSASGNAGSGNASSNSSSSENKGSDARNNGNNGSKDKESED